MTSSGHVVVTGAGSPVTVFAPGLASSIKQTRPFGSGVRGRRVFFPFRGHEPEPLDRAEPWSYSELAAQLSRVADRTGATRALGVSLGAGALLRLLADDPDRFERAVMCLPAVLDRRAPGPAERMARLGALAATRDRDGLARQLLSEQPAELRAEPPVRAWVADQVELLTRPDLVRALAELPELRPIEDRTTLAALELPVLILAAEADPAHPAEVADELAAALPNARLEILGPGGLLWKHRDHVRTLISGFLNR